MSEEDRVRDLIMEIENFDLDDLQGDFVEHGDLENVIDAAQRLEKAAMRERDRRKNA